VFETSNKLNKIGIEKLNIHIYKVKVEGTRLDECFKNVSVTFSFTLIRRW